MGTEQPVLEKLKQHWLISILLLCVTVAGYTWKLEYEILVAPREFQIAQLRDDISKLKEEIQKQKASAPPSPIPAEKPNENPLALVETGVFEKASVTTNDGRCNIRVVSVTSDRVTLEVTVDALPPVRFENQQLGNRVSVQAGDDVYYIDLHRIRGDIVDLSVHRRKK